MAEVPAVLRAMLTSGAEGNPFYMEELIKMLVDDGVIVVDGERWQVQRRQVAGRARARYLDRCAASAPGRAGAGRTQRAAARRADRPRVLGHRAGGPAARCARSVARAAAQGADRASRRLGVRRRDRIRLPAPPAAAGRLRHGAEGAAPRRPRRGRGLAGAAPGRARRRVPGRRRRTLSTRRRRRAGAELFRAGRKPCDQSLRQRRGAGALRTRAGQPEPHRCQAARCAAGEDGKLRGPPGGPRRAASRAGRGRGDRRTAR